MNSLLPIPFDELLVGLVGIALMVLLAGLLLWWLVGAARRKRREVGPGGEGRPAR